MIVLQRKHARIFRLWHGWDWIKRASRPEKIGQILGHFFLGDVAHHTVVPEIYHKITHTKVRELLKSHSDVLIKKGI